MDINIGYSSIYSRYLNKQLKRCRHKLYKYADEPLSFLAMWFPETECLFNTILNVQCTTILCQIAYLYFVPFSFWSVRNCIIEISSRWNLSHGFRSHQSVQFERKVTVECCHSACAHPTNVIHLHVESCMHATWIAVRLVTRSKHPHRHQSLFFHVIFRISESSWWLFSKCLGEFSDLHYCSLPDY